MSDDASNGPPVPEGEPDPYLDAADRLERSADIQIEVINGIDEKAEHVTRLLGILLGLVFSVLSLATNSQEVDVGSTTVATEVLFFLGILSLLFAMAAGIVTYLSSKFHVGLHDSVGVMLSQSETEYEEHIRRVLGSYATVIHENRKVVETNSKRFRWALFLLLLGVLFLAAAGTLHIGQLSEEAAAVGLVFSLVSAGLAAWYILGGNYLTLDTIEGNHE